MNPENSHIAGPEPAQDETRSEALELLIQQLQVAVEQELRHHPDGISELELIRKLQKPPWSIFGAVDFSKPAKLYPVHFLLFHTLYLLRDELAADGESLGISPLVIRLTPSDIIAGSGLPAEEDGLRAFYLDISQYHLPENDIDQMVDNFWAGYRKTSSITADEAGKAARILGFDALPEGFTVIKQRFRRAVMQAHPDRGGSTEQIQNLNQAFAVLKSHYR